MRLGVTQVRVRWTAWLLAALLSGLCASCAGETQSRVEQGQPVNTGNADFDAFFKEVDALRDASSKAVAEANELPSPLARSLGLPGSSGSDATLGPLFERSKKWRDAGFRPRLSLMPKPEVERSGKAPESADEDVLGAVELSARNALALADRMRDLEQRAAVLRGKAKELSARVRVAFGSKADDVETELRAAQSVLEKTAELSAAQGGRASYFVVGVMTALEREPGAGVPGAPAGGVASRQKPAARPSGGRPRPPVSKPAAASSGPAPAKPAGKPASDFDP